MSNFKEQFQKICSDARLVGANMVIVKDDKIVENECYGYASLEQNKKTQLDTVYRIASISKTIGAIGVMQLYEEGKLDLDKDISEYFGFEIRNPKFKDIPITPKMLMMQISSITDGYDDEDPGEDDPRLGYNGVNGTNWDVSIKDLLDPNGKYYTPLTYSDYAPGTHFIYSNFGCGLMACLVEIVSGEYYVDYMIKHVFAPLNIDASFRARDIVAKENIADCYNPSRDGKGYTLSASAERFINGGYKEFPLGSSFRGPAGGLFINMPNLSKLMRVFLNRGIVDGVRILKEETVDYMYQSHWFGYGDGGSYRAKGLQMKVMHNFEDQGIVFRGHTGGAYGVRSYMYFNQKYKIGACFITNGGYCKSLSDGLLDVFRYTLQTMIDMYYPNKKPSTFTFTIGERKAYVDERQIIFDEAPYEYNGEIYLPAISLADGLGIVGDRREEEQSVRFVKDGKEITFNNLTDFDSTLMVPLYKVLNALSLKAVVKNGKVEIEYK